MFFYFGLRSARLAGEKSEPSKSLYVVLALCFWLLLTLAERMLTDVSLPRSEVVAFKSSLVRIVIEGFNCCLLICAKGS